MHQQRVALAAKRQAGLTSVVCRTLGQRAKMPGVRSATSVQLRRAEQFDACSRHQTLTFFCATGARVPMRTAIRVAPRHHPRCHRAHHSTAACRCRRHIRASSHARRLRGVAQEARRAGARWRRSLPRLWRRQPRPARPDGHQGGRAAAAAAAALHDTQHRALR